MSLALKHKTHGPEIADLICSNMRPHLFEPKAASEMAGIEIQEVGGVGGGE